MSEKRIVLAGGCFWGVERLLIDFPGVTYTEVGYTGGDLDNPKYENICTGNTGHAEAVLLKYDETTSLPKILDFFFRIHDPTTLNRQGNDIGTQYRSTIFYENDEQKKEALEAIDRANQSKRWKEDIVTTVEPLERFYSAEEAHQKYLIKHPMGYNCHFIRD